MKKLILCLIILILAACSQPAQTIDQKTIEAMVDAQIAAIPTDTPQPTYTPYPTYTAPPISPTNTPRPTNTTAPTETIAPTEAIDLTQIKAKNYIGSQESGGVILEIARILIAQKEAIDEDFSRSELFDDKPIVVEVILKIINNTDKTVTVYADQGKIAVNGEQIELFDYALEGARFGDDLGGEILPGVTVIGGIWIGVKRTPFDDINKIIIQISSPRDADYHELGPEFNITVDVVDWGYEEVPDELR